MMHVKMMIFAAGKRRCGDPDRGGRFVRHHGILYMYQTFLSLFASNEPKLSPSVFDTNACPLSLYINRTQRKAHSWLFKCVYLKYYKSWKPLVQMNGDICHEKDILNIEKYNNK